MALSVFQADGLQLSREGLLLNEILLCLFCYFFLLLVYSYPIIAPHRFSTLFRKSACTKRELSLWAYALIGDLNGVSARRPHRHCSWDYFMNSKRHVKRRIGLMYMRSSMNNRFGQFCFTFLSPSFPLCFFPFLNNPEVLV